MDDLEEEVRKVLRQSKRLIRRVEEHIAREKLFAYELEKALDPKKHKKELKNHFK